MKEKLWTKFYECSCGTEGIMLSQDDKVEQIRYLAFFAHGFKGRQLGFIQRLRYAFKILKTGLPFEDEVVLDKDTALDLGKDLLEWGASPDEEV